jgi:hypothetical protein
LLGESAREAEVISGFQEEGSMLVVGEMWLQVPFRRGFLRESITRRFSAAGFEVYPVASYAPIVNVGSAPNVIRAVNASALRFELPNGGVVFAKYGHHPGFSGRHFVKTAEAVRERLRGLVAELLRRVYGGAGWLAILCRNLEE